MCVSTKCVCWSCGPCCPCPGSEPCRPVPVPSEAPSQGLQCSWVTRASPAHPVCLPEQGGFRHHPRLCCDLAAWASLLPALRNSREISCGAPLSGNVSGQILLLECSASSPHPAEVLAFEQCWLHGPSAGGIPMVCAGHDTSCSLTGQGGTAPQGHTKH